MQTLLQLTWKNRSSFSIAPSFICDPLEQFEVVSILRIDEVIFFNNLALTWVAATCVLSLVIFTYSPNLSTKYHFVTNALYSLVKSVVQENLYISKQQYFRPLFFLFSTLLVSNLIGLLPFAFTITSSFAITFFLALTHFVGVNVVGVTRHQWNLANLFLPAGVPLAITPFLVLIELISYFARVLSLSIRLFANRRSGHALLKILIGFALARGASSNFLLNLLSVFPWSVVTAVRFLELLIAFLQAHVFTILVTIYLNDTLTLH